jgi:gliding motility-associated-like protein
MIIGHTTLSAQGFLESKGRLPKGYAFSKQMSGATIYLNPQGYSLLLRDNAAYDSLWQHFHAHKTLLHPFTVKYHRFDMQFIGAQTKAIEPLQANAAIQHFFIGNDPKQWHTNLKTYQTLLYKNLYPQIDWELIEMGKGLKHNFIIKPGGQTKAIQMHFNHANGVEIKKGLLYVNTSVGNMIEQAPIAFQIINDDTVFVKAEYQFINSESTVVGLNIGNYNHAYELIIDPILVFSTYSGSQGDNFGFTATYDSKSHLYAGGIVDGGTGADGGPFPITPGAFQTVYSGGVGQAPANLPCDIGINKYDSAGNTLLYSTYLGGSRDEYPHSLVVDNQDNLMVLGTSYSQDFPIDINGFDTTSNGGTDIFISKLSADGSSLLAGTYFGGSSNDGLNTNTLRYNYADDFRGDIIVDKYDNVYVASTSNSTDFPIRNAFQTTRASSQDGCVFSFNAGLNTLRFSSFFGGNKEDALYSIRLYDTFLYVAGGTASGAMPFAVNGNKNNFIGGRADGMVAKLSQNGKLIASSYFGTDQYDQIYFLDIDANGQIYAAGQTEGNISRTPGTYGKDNTSQFIVRFDPSLSVINLATTFGNRTNDPEIAPSAFLVDNCDNIYFSGWGSPINYNGLHSLTTANLQVSSNAIQATTDNEDFYLLVLNKNASQLLYATYFGGNQTEDHVDGGTSRFDKRGVVYQSVCSSCPEPNQHYDDFPVSNNAPFKTNLSPRCSNASFKIDFQITFEVDAMFIATPNTGCEDLEVQFNNKSLPARHYYWDFGDGSKIDTTRNPKHLYTQPGTYKVKLTCVDSFSCNIKAADSTIITVKAMPKADFELSTKECSNEFSFTNKSSDYIKPVWDFGDSSQLDSTTNPKHTYKKDGLFKVLLSVEHPSSGCIDTQTMPLPVFLNPVSTIKIPNVFTPNTDQINDCYSIGGINPNCDEAEIWIYNRWGILVFNGYLPLNCWNGGYNNENKPLADGTYYYILRLKSKNPQVNYDTKYEGVIRVIR